MGAKLGEVQVRDDATVPLAHPSVKAPGRHNAFSIGRSSTNELYSLTSIPPTQPLRSENVRPMLSTTAALAASMMLVAGCASDGRDLAEPTPDQTTTTRPPPPTSAPPFENSSTGVALTSPDFEPGGLIPVSATCAGQNVFPTLDWGEVPEGAVELAVTLADQTDPDEPLLLWLMAGIDPDVTGLESGRFPNQDPTAFETLNDYGNPGYGEPCLDTFSSGRRDIQFRLYVLMAPSELEPGAPGNDSWRTLRASSVESATLLARVDSQN